MVDTLYLLKYTNNKMNNWKEMKRKEEEIRGGKTKRI